MEVRGRAGRRRRGSARGEGPRSVSGDGHRQLHPGALAASARGGPGGGRRGARRPRSRRAPRGGRRHSAGASAGKAVRGGFRRAAVQLFLGRPPAAST
eukprot:6193844-Pleurochrysis_carterae.AAC.3